MRKDTYAALITFRERRRDILYGAYGDDWIMHEPDGKATAPEARDDLEQRFIDDFERRIKAFESQN